MLEVKVLKVPGDRSFQHGEVEAEISQRTVKGKCYSISKGRKEGESVYRGKAMSKE